MNDGWQLSIAAKEREHVPSILDGIEHLALQAPTLAPVKGASRRQPINFAGIAWNLGFNDASGVIENVTEWRTLIDEVKPDIVLSDFGVSAFSVAKAMGIPVLRVGTGFECPPCKTPLVGFKHHDFQKEKEPWDPSTTVMDHLSTALASLQLPAVESMSDMLGDDESQVLATVKELDHYERELPPEKYCEPWDHIRGGTVPNWSGERRLRAIAYLKPFRDIVLLMNLLNDLNVDVAIAGVGFPGALRSQLPTNTSVSDRLFDIQESAKECDFAITNGNHGTTLQAICRGLPVIACPLYIEQVITGMTVQELGFGICVSNDQTAGLKQVPDFIGSLKSFPNVDQMRSRYDIPSTSGLEHAVSQIKRIA